MDHHLLCERAKGSQDPSTGAYSESSRQVVYDGPVDAQQLSSAMWSRRQLANEASGTIEEPEAELQIFIALERKISDFKLGDTATLTWDNGDTSRIQIVGIRRLDGSLQAKQTDS